MNSETRICSCCGDSFEAVTGKRGRPRIYCSHDCKELAFHLGKIEDLLSGRRSGSHDSKKRLRSMCFYLANQLNGKAAS